MYAYDARLGWFPVPDSSRSYYNGIYATVATHNHHGFRDRDHGAKDRPRLLFLGDSFTWGYGVGDHDRFTDLLERHLPGWEVFNEGVSGYGTDQELLVLEQTVDDVAPDLVGLIFCGNDTEDNSTNNRYEGYFKPYFVEEDGALQLRGVPVPKSINYYAVAHSQLFRSRLVRTLADAVARLFGPETVLNHDPTAALLKRMHELVESRHAGFFVGFIDDVPKLERFLEQEHVPTLRLQTKFRFKDPAAHWTPEGHAEIAGMLKTFLGNQGLLAGK